MRKPKVELKYLVLKMKDHVDLLKLQEEIKEINNILPNKYIISIEAFAPFLLNSIVEVKK